MARQVLQNQSYVGDVVNFKTYSKSYKLKDRLENPRENWDIHEGVHEPIIERSRWEAVQKTFGQTKYRKPKHVEKHMLAGFLGTNLNYKYTHDNPDNRYFSCRNKRANNGLCATTHHIRVDTITEILTRQLSEILHFASLFEDEQSALKQNIKHLRSVVEEEKAHEMNADGFLELVRRYTNADNLILTPEILHEFIERWSSITGSRWARIPYRGLRFITG